MIIYCVLVISVFVVCRFIAKGRGKVLGEIVT